MAFAQRLKNGYRICYRIAGKRHYITSYEGRPLTSKPMTEPALAHARLLEVNAKRSHHGAVLSMETIINQWKAAKLGGDAPNDEWSTKNAASRVLTHCTAQEWASPADITPAEIARWRGATARTSRVGALLRSVLWWAKDTLEQPVPDAVLAALRPPKQLRKIKPPLLTASQVQEAQKAATAISANAGALIHCLATYGWRPITAAEMLVGDLSGDEIACRVKGGGVIQHPLLPETMALLSPLVRDRKPSEPLFLDPRTERAWRRHNHAIGHWTRPFLKIHAYDLKRFAISRLLDVLPVHEVQAFTGHRTASQVLTYARTNQERQRASLKKLRAVSQSESADPDLGDASAMSADENP